MPTMPAQLFHLSRWSQGGEIMVPSTPTRGEQPPHLINGGELSLNLRELPPKIGGDSSAHKTRKESSLRGLPTHCPHGELGPPINPHSLLHQYKLPQAAYLQTHGTAPPGWFFFVLFYQCVLFVCFFFQFRYIYVYMVSQKKRF